MPGPVEILRANRARVLRVAETTDVNAVNRLLADARRELERRLIEARSRGLGERYTGDRIRTTLAVIRDVQGELAHAMRVNAGDRVARLAERGIEDVARYVRAMEAKYSGITPELSIGRALVMDSLVSGTKASLLRQHETSVTRYGEHMIGEMENALRLGVATGATNQQMIDAISRTRAPAGWRPGTGMTGAEGKVSGEFVRQQYWAERIVRTECLPGDTLVSGAVVRAAFRRAYDGPLAEVVTEHGRRFSATPNHPMLTRRGWIAAGELRKGDDLICDAWKERARPARDEHVAAPPSTLREIFDAITAVGVRERRRGGQPDFHGDGSDGDVDVACPGRELMFGRFAALDEPSVKHLLAPSDQVRARFCAACRRLLPIDQRPCGCGRAQRDACIEQSPPHHRVADAERYADGSRALAGEITAHDLIGRDVSAEARMRPSTAHERVSGVGERTGHACAAHDALHGPPTNADAFRDDRRAQPGDVQLDRVASVRFRDFRGHVFNLSTSDGYYTINGAFTGNTLASYNAAGWRSMVELHDIDFPDMKRIILATFDSRTADDSKYVHGQIRGVREQFYDGKRHYLHPPARPNDRETVVPHRSHWRIPAIARPD